MNVTWAEIWDFVKYMVTNKWVILTVTHLATFYFGVYLEYKHHGETEESLRRDMEAIRQITNKY